MVTKGETNMAVATLLPKEITITTLPIVSVHTMRLAMPTEVSTYDTGTVTNGFGNASGVYVTVQKGTSAKVDIDFTIETVSEEDFNKWWNDSKSYFDDEHRQTLEGNWGRGGFMGGFLGGAFGILFGAGDANHYKNQSDSHWQATSSEQQGFVESVHNLTTSQFHVTGTLTAEGTSYIPVTVSAYVEVTKIKFADNKELHVINTGNPIAAQKSGSTEGVDSQPTSLNVTSL